MSWEWSFRSYVSAAEKRRRSQRAADAYERNGQKLSPVRIDGQMIARSFWGKAWCSNLESYSDYANRLPRGRSYVRNGSVIDLQIAPGVVSALVSGTDLYQIKINIDPVKQVAWKALKKECAGHVGSLIDLLQGRLSAHVMEIITRRDTGLFPKPVEIGLNCSCPDWAEMCKHVAATLYAVGARLDQNPELLFLLRGADHLELISEATESVTSDVLTSSDSSGTLVEASLEEVFGIEIEPSVVSTAGKPAETAVYKRKKASAGKTSCRSKQARRRLKKKEGKLTPATRKRVNSRKRQGAKSRGTGSRVQNSEDTKINSHRE
jgi:uncharacterized Zn finger protein